MPCLGRPERKHHARVGERRDLFASEQQSFSAKKCSEVVPRCPQHVQTCCKTNGDSLPHACNIAQNAWVFSWKPQLHAGGFANSAPGGRGLGHTFADGRVGPLLRILVVPVMIVAPGTPFYLLRVSLSVNDFYVSYDFWYSWMIP